MAKAKPKTKNDAAWEQLFASHNIITLINQKGIYRISAEEINREREARLMTKFDQRANLPKVFSNNNLSILPDSRGTYLIGRFNTYQNLIDDSSAEIINIPFPPEIETIDPTNLYSEAAGLLCAYNTGIIDDLIGEEVRLTIGGRMSTGVFDYKISTIASPPALVTVNNAQCEIDGGFESASSLALIEAKNYGADDFLIRQLYYPYRLWRSRTRKQVIPIFMSYSNDVFSFYVFHFRDDMVYNSIELVGQKKYRIAPEQIVLADILAVLHEAEQMLPTASPTIPFPQANSFKRIVDLLGLLKANSFLSQDQVASNYTFTGRQAHYYPTAGIYLGLIERRIDKSNGSVIYILTDEGKSIMDMRSQQKFLSLVKVILRNRVFSRSLKLYLEQSARPSEDSIIQIMIEEKVRVNKSTIPRRAQTVLAWIDWILQLQHPT